MRKLVIINQPLANRGDQSAHKALIRLLHTIGDLHLTVLSIDSPALVERFSEGIQGVNYVTFPPFRKRTKLLRFFRRVMSLPFGAFTLPRILLPALRRYNRVIEESDYVLCAPGGICMGGYMDWIHIWGLANAIRLGKPTGIFGRSIGPFRNTTRRERIFTKWAVDILNKVDYLSLRDQHSQSIAAALNVPCVPTVDTAFFDVPDQPLPQGLSHLAERKFAVFVPNRLYQWHSTFRGLPGDVMDRFYGKILEDLLSLGLDVVMLPQLFAARNLDKPYFEELARSLDPERVVVVDDTHDSDVQQAIIRHAAVVVGARYHSAIFAINNSVPLICLSYEHKMSGTLELLGLREYSLPLEDLVQAPGGAGDLSSLLRTILETRPAVVERIEKARRQADALAREAFSRFQLALDRSTT